METRNLRLAPQNEVEDDGCLLENHLMLNIHHLIASHGIDAARRLAVDKAERGCIDAAAAVMNESVTAADVGYAVLGSSCLPHKSLDRSAGSNRWSGKIDNVDIALASGRYPDGSDIGIPYGSKARIILVYLTTAAVLSSSPRIELGPSMYAWLRTMSTRKFGGMTYRLFTEQARRIAAMSVRASVESEAETLVLSGRSIAELVAVGEPTYRPRPADAGFPTAAVLARGYWEASKTHSCAIRLCALRELGNNGTAIDLYVWLAHRLSRLQQPEHVEWPRLHAMFGGGYRHLRQMKRPLFTALQLTLAVYPGARVEIDAAGMTLFPGPPPVPAEIDEMVRKLHKPLNIPSE